MAQASNPTEVAGTSRSRTGTSVVTISDSQGRGLQSVFNNIKDKGYEVTVLFWKGRGITEAVKESKTNMDGTRYNSSACGYM